ncbi:DDE-type integrase/transposase/recombinase [Candidatus Bipolaricaulota bacterium]|nr:DDE-type integrase/transposase/recombinase [Candidatus Bipolaricaulota bacterium]
MINNSKLSVKDTCELLKLSPRRYYRWKDKYEENGISGLEDQDPGPNLPYNKILPVEREAILEAADKYTDLKHRKLVPKLADEWSVSVSASTVYRVLKEEGQISSKDDTGKADNSRGDYDYTPEEPNELWQIDISYIPIKNHDFRYLISALDDYSRKIMNHVLSPTMGARDLVDVIDEGILDYDLAEDPPKFLTDNGTQMTSTRFKEYVKSLDTDHLRTAYNHPETIGKIERYHRTVKDEDVFPKGYDDPFAAKKGIKEFIDYYNYERPHEALGQVTPQQKYEGVAENIKEHREKLKKRSLERRKKLNKLRGVVQP